MISLNENLRDAALDAVGTFFDSIKVEYLASGIRIIYCRDGKEIFSVAQTLCVGDQVTIIGATASLGFSLA